MIKKLKDMNEVLPFLLINILIWGVLWQVLGIWFVKDKLSCSIGLWIGVFTAMAMAIHMAWSLNIAVDYGEKDATALMTKHNLIRYGIVLIVEGTVMITGFANPLTAFLGIMGLKVAAYLEPITHKLFRR